jgi:hypothetical protein
MCAPDRQGARARAPPTVNGDRWYQPGIGVYSQPDPGWLDSVLFDNPQPIALSSVLYGDARPLVMVDPLGLLRFRYGKRCRNLPAETLRALEQAAADAAVFVPLTPQCAKRPREVVHIRCRSCGGNCGSQGGGSRICVNLDYHTNNRCGLGPQCLVSTILHEVVHACGGGERAAYACERRFIPQEACQARTPERYLPNPEEPCPCGGG